MTAIGRLIGGPCNGQTVIIGQTVEYVPTPAAELQEPGDPDQMQMYVYDGQDPQTREHLFRWSGK